MAKVQALRFFVNQRLTAAAEEIFELFERTIAEYEEQLSRSKEENERKQKLLDDVFNHQLNLHGADVQQLSVSKEEVLPEQQEWIPSLDKEVVEPPLIKEEEEELWHCQEEQEEPYTTKFPFAPVPVKGDYDEEKLQSSQLHLILTEQMETGADGEGCGGPEQAWNSEYDRHLHPETQGNHVDSSEAETEVNIDWRRMKEHQSSSSYLETFKEKSQYTDEKTHRCYECGNTFKTKRNLIHHIRIHTGEKPFSCSKCDKKFSKKVTLTTHMLVHTEEKLFSCSECGQKFKHKSNRNRHMLLHTGEKPFGCLHCGLKYSQKTDLTRHLARHRGEKPFGCKVCNQRFSWSSQLRRHRCVLDQA
ncbi:zinc finger protein 567-like [Cheilinus undulatus]|uniref:zinc finger protein 567-like n=1 Tax=Cheilinus undulatus TaxID=241271 RepID=UPI001BD1DF9E|nr:zinc finger protein 567-like [Cheilinus undulatus]